MMMEGGFRRNRQSGSSALECGRLKLWVIGLLGKGFRPKASSPDRLFLV